MLIAALSTGHKVGLGLVGLTFVVFALLAAFVLPAVRPDFPGKRGLPAFLTVSVALFVAMMFAVFFFGREPSESHAAAETTTTQAQTTAPTTTAPTTASTTTAPSTSAATTTSAAPKTIPVTEVEFKIELPTTSLAAGTYTFNLTNKGHVGHDLVFNGPGVNNEKTPVIDPGQTAKLTVDLKSGTYDVYCSVPGHKQAGMDVKVTVS